MKQSGGIGNILILFEALLLVVVLVLGGMSFLKNPRVSKEQIIVDATEDAITEYIDTEVETETAAEVSEQVAQVTFSEEVLNRLTTMSTEDKVAHLFLTSPESLTGNDLVTIAGDGTRTALETYPVTGLIYTGENFKGRRQFGALLSGAQRYNIESNSEYLLLAVRDTAENGNETIAISSLYDVGPLQQLAESGQMQGNEGKIYYPVVYPSNTQAISADSMCIIIGNETDAALTEEENLPCSLSAKAISSLRQTYQYQGVILTANLSQETVASAYPAGQAAVKAVLAGADLLCVTDQFAESYQAVLDAVNSGEIPMSRIDEAVGRILTMKNNMPSPTDGDIAYESDDQTTASQTEQNNNNTQTRQNDNTQAAAGNNTQAAAEPDNAAQGATNQNTQTTASQNNGDSQETSNQNSNNEQAASNENNEEQQSAENENSNIIEPPVAEENNNENTDDNDDPESVTQSE